MHAPGEKLRQARRMLDGLHGLQEIGEWTWNSEESRWTLAIKIRHGLPTTEFVPEVTGWLIVPDNEDLVGAIEVYPAIDDGIKTTFQHQRFNEVDEKYNRRTGRPCLTRPSHRLKRNSGQEPMGDSERLAWRVNRLIEWLIDAANGDLTRNGEPFELPDFSGADSLNTTIAFQETPENIPKWLRSPRYGIADISLSKKVILVKEFQNGKSFTAVNPLQWGGIGRQINTESSAIWIRLESIPIDSPWRPPSTFGELKAMLQREGLDLRTILSEQASKQAKHLRRGKPLLVLIGFPIPKTIGGEVYCFHWQAVFAPPVSSGKTPGFRDTPDSMKLCDKMNPIPDAAKLEWRNSENWSEENLKTRGSFSSHASHSKITIFGVGALGSAVAELLARGGYNNFLLIDPDVFHAGNAVRHPLRLSDVGYRKAEAIAARLKLVRPQMNVEAINKYASNLDEADLKSVIDSSLIIDATGSDDMLLWAESRLKTSQAAFVSLSFGYAAKRLFCYASSCGGFSKKHFQEKITPWIAHEKFERSPEELLPQEGIGCWSVVFPARADDVWLLASAGVKWIDQLSELTLEQEEFDVFEQTPDNGSFTGLRKVKIPPTTN